MNAVTKAVEAMANLVEEADTGAYIGPEYVNDLREAMEGLEALQMDSGRASPDTVFSYRTYFYHRDDVAPPESVSALLLWRKE